MDESVETPVRTKRRRLTPEARRAEIIATATKLISTRGYNGLAFQDVADTGGMTLAGILHYFSSKEDLLISVLEARDEEDRQHSRQVMACFGNNPIRGIDAFVERNAAQPEIIRLYAVVGGEALDPRHPAHSYFQYRYDRALRNMSSLLDGVVADPDSTARQLIATQDGLQLQWFYSNYGFDLLEQWKILSGRFLPR